MENKEDVLNALEEFAKKPTDKVPPLLDQYLSRVAQTGETLFPWSKVRPLFVHKLEVQMKAFDEWIPMDDLDPLPNVENVTFTEIQTRLLKYINSFSSAPFTIQRLCELVTDPRKHYRRVDKWLRGVEKNLLVVSSVDPFGNKIVCEPKPMVNGLDANGYDQHDVGEEAVPVSPFLPPPVPPSSVQGSPVVGTNWRENSCLSMSPQCTWAAGTNGTPPQTPCEDPGERAAMAMEASVSSSAPSPVAAPSFTATSSSSDSSADDGSDGEPAQKKLKLSDDHCSEVEPESPLQAIKDVDLGDSVKVVSSDTPAASISGDTETQSAVCSSTETTCIPDKVDQSQGDEVSGAAKDEQKVVISEKETKDEEEMEAESSVDSDQEKCGQPVGVSENKTEEEEKEAAAAVRREESLAEATEQSNSSGFDTPVEAKTMEETEAATSFEVESSTAAESTPMLEPAVLSAPPDTPRDETKQKECDSNQSEPAPSAAEEKESAEQVEMENSRNKEGCSEASTDQSESEAQPQITDTKLESEQTMTSSAPTTPDEVSTSAVTTTALTTSELDTLLENSTPALPSDSSSSSPPPAVQQEPMETD